MLACQAGYANRCSQIEFKVNSPEEMHAEYFKLGKYS